ncbi:nucleotide exchange factor GrpE [Nesterenkonia massiliensis]|uniref:Protein GrpE n=1 Tax=Nesterenkonia massiliensis TaxID=1232429 RepID=A0ABT2HNR8_9MICC|nr:nucleotide exchange factor GrpE [Nesterenkonia massiliensis]MCT1606336.1 nucleotide exchange factor GrpE [Nesterenkonia massiliensis]
MAEDKYNPEKSPQDGIPDPTPARDDKATGEATAEDREAAGTDPAADPLAEAERILADAPEESIEVQQAHAAPAGEEGDLHEPLPGEDPELSEEPELREVPLDEAIGGSETEPESRIEAAEEELAAQGYDREAELENDLRRVQAEYVNYRRRVERDRALEKDRTKGQLIAELMPVLDDIAAARQAGDLEDGPFAHIAARLESALTAQGLETVGAVGEAFDPTEHEAIMQQPHDEVEADHIAVVIRSGYRYGDRLLRAAQVIVSSGAQQ